MSSLAEVLLDTVWFGGSMRWYCGVAGRKMHQLFDDDYGALPTRRWKALEAALTRSRSLSERSHVNYVSVLHTIRMLPISKMAQKHQLLSSES